MTYSKNKNIDKNIKVKILQLYLTLSLAIVIGVYAQDISYYIMDNIIDISAQIAIVIISVISGILFIVPSISLSKKYEIKPQWLNIYIIINFLIALPVLTFQIIVLLFWLS